MIANQGHEGIEDLPGQALLRLQVSRYLALARGLRHGLRLQHLIRRSPAQARFLRQAPGVLPG